MWCPTSKSPWGKEGRLLKRGHPMWVCRWPSGAHHTAVTADLYIYNKCPADGSKVSWVRGPTSEFTQKAPQGLVWCWPRYRFRKQTEQHAGQGPGVKGTASIWEEILLPVRRRLGLRWARLSNSLSTILATNTGNYEDTILMNSDPMSLREDTAASPLCRVLRSFSYFIHWEVSRGRIMYPTSVMKGWPLGPLISSLGILTLVVIRIRPLKAREKNRTRRFPISNIHIDNSTGI